MADEAVSVFATDLDGDADTDVLSASVSDDTIAWYENDGAAPPAFTEHIITTTADAAFSVFAVDVDGDGDTDVLSASAIDDTVAWYENDGGSPPTFEERIISATTEFAQWVHAADMDGDGDTDVLATSIVDHKIVWFENDGSLPPVFTERIVSTEAHLARQAFAMDLDGDRDTDVLSLSAADDEIVWYQHLPSIGASVGGVRLRRVLCSNLTTGETGTAYVTQDSVSATSWTCTGLGVSADPGDRVLLLAIGSVSQAGTVGGSVTGLTSPLPHHVTCHNLTTAQTVQFTTLADAWDCEAEGLMVSPGDWVRLAVKGDV